MDSQPDPDAYWNTNIPTTQHTLTPPPFLSPTLLPLKDQEILKTPNASYHILSWSEVLDTIQANRLDLFQRTPLELRRYLAYNHAIKQQYGSIMAYVLEHKLGWEVPVVARGGKGDYFKYAEDWEVRVNDWPYGIDGRIKHLVVWTKFELDEDEKSAVGDLTVECRRVVDEFVERTFERVVGKENVVWFKNWRALKSVHAVEHFHVMLYNPSPAFFESVTHGDVPMTEVLNDTTS